MCLSCPLLLINTKSVVSLFITTPCSHKWCSFCLPSLSWRIFIKKKGFTVSASRLLSSSLPFIRVSLTTSFYYVLKWNNVTMVWQTKQITFKWSGAKYGWMDKETEFQMNQSKVRLSGPKKLISICNLLKPVYAHGIQCMNDEKIKTSNPSADRPFLLLCQVE